MTGRQHDGFPRYAEPEPGPAPEPPRPPAPIGWYAARPSLPPPPQVRPPDPERVHRFGRWSLIAAACGIGPLALVFGYIGLSAKAPRARGGRLALAGLTLGILESMLLIVGLIFVASWLTIDRWPEADETGEPYLWSHLSYGDCYNDVDDEAVEDVRVVPCEQPHQGEVTGSVVLVPGPYPGRDGSVAAAQRTCDEEFERYVGSTVTETSLRPHFWSPGRKMWESGDRTVVCTTWGPRGERLVGTVRGSKR
jgi:hypothetical protein